MHLYRAKCVLPIASPPIADGVVGVARGRFAAVGRRRDFRGRCTDLGECVLLPGLINAHCHLDYTDMAGAVPLRDSFTQWITDITALKRTWTAPQFAVSMCNGLIAASRSGTTTLCDMAAVAGNMGLAAASPMRVLSCLELIDVAGQAPDESVWRRCAGLSPHAPFTASAALYRQAHGWCRKHRRVFTTHLAESADERAMFEDAHGPLYERMAAIGRPMTDCGHGSSVALLNRLGVLRGALVAHANCLSDDDVAWLANAKAAVVHCPSSHRFFGHPPFPLNRLRTAGVAVCLGTDSAASGSMLDMRSEMRDFLAVFPTERPAGVLAMATVAAAKALNWPGVTGTLTVGAKADMIAVPVPKAATDPAAAVIESCGQVWMSMINGKVVWHES
jgi:cytosine/adenosine deaminase-related metal-dependent hydrolase